MNVVVVVNPAARSGESLRIAERATQRLRELGVHVATVRGASASESSDLLRSAISRGPDAVVVAGGDGTARLAVQELAGTGVPLGLVPCGTGNDLAATLGLHQLDADAADAAAAVVAGGHRRRIDLARVRADDGTVSYFATVLASGFDSRVNDRANAMSWPRGGSRYTLALLREFAALRPFPFHVRLEGDDGSVREREGPLVMATVGNGPTYGGGIPICPGADPADGVLDVTLVRPAGRMRLLRLLPRVYRGTHGAVPEVEMHRVRSIRLDSAGVTAYADGDPIGPLPVTVEIAPRALDVLVP
ncbi:diacylglycerol kinase [Microbacterium sp. RD1]|uniref:diacylglycerol kinase n=1 Tax=Microbacterium sp. RD1 TaxID=3457313 RepID=UPI003FA5BA9D